MAKVKVQQGWLEGDILELVTGDGIYYSFKGIPYAKPPDYGPDFLVNHGVVLVTINYRLEALGFLCMDTKEVPGNAGLKDQVQALKWVKENIAQFGGDPDNVTIFGESAGGASAALHALSPLSKGLFKRVIPMSGVPISDFSLPFEPKRRAFVLGKQLGCDTKDPAVLLEFLQSLPKEKLIDTNPTIMCFEEKNNNLLKFYHFTPVIEKECGHDPFINEDPMEIIKSGKVNPVDIMIGYTNEEGLLSISSIENLLAHYNRYDELFVPRKLMYKASSQVILEVANRIRNHYFDDKPITEDVMKEFLKYTAESVFTYDIHNFLKYFPNQGNKRYLYRFSCVSERNIYGASGAKYNITGASHLDDMMYLFDAKKVNLPIDKNGNGYKMVQQTCVLFTNFSKFGNPTPDASLGAIWQEHDNETQYYMDIGETLTPGHHLDVDIVAFWNGIFHYAGLSNLV